MRLDWPTLRPRGGWALVTLTIVLWMATLGTPPARAGTVDLLPHHRAAGDYFGFAAGGFPDYQRDRAGLPLVPYDGVLSYNPTTIGQYGLWRYSKWRRTRATKHLRLARRAADWMVRNQTTAGTWLYHFRWGISGIWIEPPWVSALAQGTGVALLGRSITQPGSAFISEARAAPSTSSGVRSLAVG